MHKNVKFRGKNVKHFFYICFSKNSKNAECNALLQGFVNEIQSSIFVLSVKLLEDPTIWGSAAPPKTYFLCKSFSLRFTEKV